MSTNSRIGIKNIDGSITSIYCHWDGYPEHTGKVLVEHYNTVEKINGLLNLGDISSLAPALGSKQDFSNPVVGTVVAYGRDRGEEEVDAQNSVDLQAFLKLFEEYNYLFDSGEWYLIEEIGI